MENGKKIIVALGGNALEEKGRPSTAQVQLEVIRKTSQSLADIYERGYSMGIVHGNGPQVGRIVLATEAAKSVTPAMPFDVCGAMSQGYIGYHIQQALAYVLRQRGQEQSVVSIVTQVVVDEKDKAFQNLSKPIGPFYNEEEAKKIALESGYTMKEDAGRGYRRVVASPIPVKIVELDIIKKLWGNSIIVTCGGGGIPVIEKANGELEGIASVIDKDLAAERLAEDIDADILLILTEVEQVSINFNKPDQKNLSEITCEEAEKYRAEGHFAPGSMLPKVTAAINFAKSKKGRKAIITSLYKATEALDGKNGTTITM